MRAIVTQRESLGPHGGPIDSLEREYVDFLGGMGFEVFPVSNFAADAVGFVAAVEPELVVLTGGGIIQAEAYRYPVSGWHQDERDRMEDELIRVALEAGIPLLGICRGMHKLNALFGGKVSGFDDLPAPREIGALHPVELADGQRFYANHFHRDGLYPADLGDGVETLACDPGNGTVEALRHEELAVLGVQWHPERMAADDLACKWVEAQVALLLG